MKFQGILTFSGSNPTLQYKTTKAQREELSHQRTLVADVEEAACPVSPLLETQGPRNQEICISLYRAPLTENQDGCPPQMAAPAKCWLWSCPTLFP